MTKKKLPLEILDWLAGILLLVAATAAWAQPPDLELPGSVGPDGGGFQFGSTEGVLGEGDRVPKLEAGFTTPGPDHKGQLFISATLPPGAHTYSITQPPNATVRTVITVDPTAGVHVTGEFHSVDLPHVTHDEDAFPGIPLEEHSGTVKWVAPIQFDPGVRPENVSIQGKVKAQLCDAKGCVQPKDYPFTATLRTDVQAVAIEGKQAPQTATSGPPLGPTSAPPPSPSPTPRTAPDSSTAGGSGGPPLPATTRGGVSSAPSTEIGKPRVPKGDGVIDWVPFTNASELKEIVGPGFDLEQIRENVRKAGVGLGFFGAIFAGFVGGLLLNIMPCVLPVIGLKIVSFVEQSGHDRRKAFMLNVWYSAGLLAVFFIFASLAVGPQKLGWGELFGKTWFTITLTSVVFVMALSFMGVWEVPLPAFLGSGKAGKLAAHEGGVGAFFKGALTTFLATPCSAPFLAPALVWATAQPPWLTYAVFLSTGLGMASPYLLIGAFPELLRFLPKPGAWMETFKNIMGFVLMGTVVYFLAVLDPVYVVPTVGLLFGLSFMCWWIGRIAPVADPTVKLRIWAQGAAFVCVVWIIMFPGLNERILGRFHFPGVAGLMAERLAPAANAAAIRPAAGIIGPNTVLVAFTADWCQTCHFYEGTTLRTAPVIESLRRLGVVTVKADWSHDDPEVSSMLEVLNGKQIPVIAIFSAKDPNHPAVFRGSYTQQEILDALEKAGPSPRSGGSLARAM